MLMKQYGNLISSQADGYLKPRYILRGIIECFSKLSTPPKTTERFTQSLPRMVVDCIFLYDYYHTKKKDVFSLICLTYQERINSYLRFQAARLSGSSNISARNELDLLLSRTYIRFQRELEKKKTYPPKYMPILSVLKPHAQFAFGEFCRSMRVSMHCFNKQIRIDTETPFKILCQWELIDALMDSVYHGNLTELEKTVFTAHALDDKTFINIRRKLGRKRMSISRIYDSAISKIRRHFSLNHHSLYDDLMETI